MGTPDNERLVLYTQTGLSLIMIIAWVYLIVTGITPPALFDTVIGIIIGAYFTRNGKAFREQGIKAFKKPNKTED